jgi:PhoH-like ATPase
MSTNGHPKHFVVDTNVLLHNPNALFMFEENEVVIPLA